MYTSCAMATPREFNYDQPALSPRPSRVRRIPGHLEDFELTYPAHRLYSTTVRPASPLTTTYAAPLSPGSSPNYPAAGHYGTASPEERWQRLESRWQTISQQMKELEVEMDRVRLPSYPQSAHLPYPSYHYAAFQPHYSSLPHLELGYPVRPPSPRAAPNIQHQVLHAPTQAPAPQVQVDTAASNPQPASEAMSVPAPASTAPPACSPPLATQPVPPALTQPALPFAPPPATLMMAPPVSLITPPPEPHVPQPVPSTTPLQPEHVPPEPQYDALPRAWQSVPLPYPPVHYPRSPRGQHCYPTPHPVDSSHQPSMMEMAIASSFGIPKPKLTVFSSGKESDFLMLKKGLDSLLGPHKHLSEDYKYQILLDHLTFPSALQVAKRYVNSQTPYTSAMQALTQRYGQPRQLVQGELKAILNAPPVRAGDYQAFEDFATAVGTLVGMLSTMEGPSSSELKCGSHVDTLLTKLPTNYRDAFAEHCFNRGIIQSGSDRTYTLPDLAEWLERKAQTLQVSRQITSPFPAIPAPTEYKDRKAVRQQRVKPATILLGSQQGSKPANPSPSPATVPPLKKRDRFKPFCPYCNNQEHYLNACADFATLTCTARAAWIKEKKRCWKCGRGHSPENCTLKKPCATCGEQHLLILHDVAAAESVLTVNTSSSMVFLDQVSHSGRVMLKVVPVRLQNGEKTLDTYAVLDDGSERTIILPAAVHHLGLVGTEEILSLRTIRQEIVQLKGATVSFQVSGMTNRRVKYDIHQAFTAAEVTLAEQSRAADLLTQRYKHLRGLSLQSFDKVQPLLLIGSDNPHLIIPTQPVRTGPVGGPVAVCTMLGWAIQGPASFLQQPTDERSCLHLSTLSSSDELHQHVQRLWQLDTLPFHTNKEVTRSGEDKAAIERLEQGTVRVTVDGVVRYATPLLRRQNAPVLRAPPTAVMALLRATERRLCNNPDQAAVYNEEIHKLEKAGYVVKISMNEASSSAESWFIPHHIVYHNNKPRIVFNCSFNYRQASLNKNLLPGPVLGSTLLGVLLRFREYAVAISGDIRGMFHQVRLLPEDQPLLRFLWRDGERERSPDVYEWRVLPFGTTCSPCCATYALQRHVKDHSEDNEEALYSVLHAFYVDNCLQSLQSQTQAKDLIDKMRALLASGGFEIRQWASNTPEVISHLPTEAKSTECELWLTTNKTEPQESSLGLLWRCSSDTLGYKHRAIPRTAPTLRYVYRVLASQYDPLGYIIPFTTRAKVLVQALWKKERGWDEPIADELLSVWLAWESELPYLPNLSLPRCYTPGISAGSPVNLHIFCDASERAYGAVAYLRVETDSNEVKVAFVMARSRVAPKRQLSIPRLELCAALAGAQLAKVLQTELTLPLQTTTLWTDSTTVLHWIQSESQQYKVFVGTRIAEIQELVGAESWRYVPSEENPADDITRGKSLRDLTKPTRWTDGPAFLHQPPASWPTHPTVSSMQEEEIRDIIFCGNISTSSPLTPDLNQFKSWTELIHATYHALHGAAAPPMTASSRREAEIALLKRSQSESFPAELAALQSGKTISPNSRLLSLSPELDHTVGLIRVGGRLRRAENLKEDTIHPIVLAPDHPVTKLVVQDYDNRLLHAGPDRIFAEMRRTYWILRGRQIIKRHQRSCVECCKWRSKPVTPQMADLPAARLRVTKPPYWSTGVDCFGPYTIKIGRRHEKRWGIIFKCLTTRCVHLDLLCSMNTDSFLLALRRFVARRGKPFEILCDRGTNFRGGERELREDFAAMEPVLKQQLAEQSINFKFNPPLAPHFGGTWEREIKSVKASLRVVLKDQAVQEEVLMTMLVEVEGILNSKPLGYATSDIADPDPITPNLLLMGRRDASLPQAVYSKSDRLGHRRWRHSQVLADHFWVQFTRNYLPNLQLRQKWRITTKGSVASWAGN
ncbi:uncharacterized protein LOC134619834 [Pelmatolapia mariae]|uniref:uncharacterized protein LOC134619834 n=1 Tax=Pelmatolapia mariae TaxID=158779 RepID=UPI002FE5F70E